MKPFFGALLAAGLALAQDTAVWRSGSGAWNDPAHWSAGLPTPYGGVDVRGNSVVTVPPGTWVAGDLRVCVGAIRGQGGREGGHPAAFSATTVLPVHAKVSR